MRGGVSILTGMAWLIFQPATVVTLDKLMIDVFVITKHQLSMDDNDVFTVGDNKKTHPNSCQDAPRSNFTEVCNAV